MCYKLSKGKIDYLSIYLSPSLSLFLITLSWAYFHTNAPGTCRIQSHADKPELFSIDMGFIISGHRNTMFWRVTCFISSFSQQTSMLKHPGQKGMIYTTKHTLIH